MSAKIGWMEIRGILKTRRDNMDEIRTMDQAVKAVANREGKYLTFVLAGEEYGIGILKVKEIIGIMAITTVPQTPSYMKGVINLRGKVIPIVDLRVKFRMEAIDYTEKTCIIVVEITSNNQKVMIGILVDSVSEVLNIKGGDIEDTPNFGSRLNTNYILGMAKTGGRVKILLEIDRVLSSEEMGELEKAA
jgi:purine-binding chemotaxis protein CheW